MPPKRNRRWTLAYLEYQVLHTCRKNSAKLFNKLLKAKYGLTWEWRNLGSHRTREACTHSQILLLTPYLVLGREHGGNIRNQSRPTLLCRPRRGKQQLLQGTPEAPSQSFYPTEQKPLADWERGSEKDLRQGKRQGNVLAPDHLSPLKELESGTPIWPQTTNFPRLRMNQDNRKYPFSWPLSTKLGGTK